MKKITSDKEIAMRREKIDQLISDFYTDFGFSETEELLEENLSAIEE